MRWFVEVSPIGKQGKPAEKLCVEAAQWQPALQKARELRGDGGSFSNFSIELLDDGYRAIDPMARLRYMVRRAPEDAELTATEPAKAPPEAEKPAKPQPAGRTKIAGSSSVGLKAPSPPKSSVPRAPAPGEEAPAPSSKKAPASERSPTSSRRSRRRKATSTPAQMPMDEVPRQSAPPPTTNKDLPDFERFLKRENEPTEASPLLYREYAYAVGPTVSRPAAEALIRDRFEAVRAQLADCKSRKYVNLAVFDHKFDQRPKGPPIVTLTFKDWVGSEPNITFPPRPAAKVSKPAAPAPSQPPPAPSQPPPGPSQPDTRDTVVDSGPPTEPEEDRGPPTPRHGSGAPPALMGDAAVEPLPKLHDGEPGDADATSPSHAPFDVPASPPSLRLAGDELLAELFEAFHELEFLTTGLEGAEFVLNLTDTKLPCEISLVSFYDINTREFVVVRQHGGKQAILSRVAERTPIPQRAMRSHRAVVIADASGNEQLDKDPRWSALGGKPKSLICAPVELAGRYLGLIEIVNPIDGTHFTEGDGHALTYIGQQFAEFLGPRGITVDPDVITLRPNNLRR